MAQQRRLQQELKIAVNNSSAILRMNKSLGSLAGCKHWESFTGMFVKLVQQSRLFVDVGAAFGFYSAIALHYSKCNVWMLEPDAVRFAVLSSLYASNPRAHVLPVAASDSEGCIVADKPAVGISLSISPGTGVSQSICTTKLDTLLGDAPVDLIKMDIEGGEVLALQGMRNLLDNQAPTVFLEIHRRKIEHIKKTGLGDIKYIFKDAGYSWYDGKGNRLAPGSHKGRVILDKRGLL